MRTLKSPKQKSLDETVQSNNLAGEYSIRNLSLQNIKDFNKEGYARTPEPGGVTNTSQARQTSKASKFDLRQY
jgi:hypothetical protein